MPVPCAQSGATHHQRHAMFLFQQCRDVAEAGDDRRHRAGRISQRLRAYRHPPERAVRRPDSLHETAHRRAGPQRHGRRQLVRGQVAPIAPDTAPRGRKRDAPPQLIERQSKNPAGCRIALHDGGVGADQHHALAYCLEDQRQPFALLHLCGDVRLDGGKPRQRAIGVMNRLDVQLDPVFATVLAAVDKFAAERQAGLQRFSHGRHRARIGA